MSALARHFAALERSRTLQRIATVIDETPVELPTDAHVRAALLATLTPILRDRDDGRINGTPAAEARLDALLGVVLSIIAAGPGRST